ncbi:hypothetical protein RJ639_011549 [Escallonia herrerae]|uniref:Uncharacterized protein n=1 Tax=Escallonia herrerae TaxID=1293975 RepID=A0AA88VLT4_9ASTE|nr:hypothetical protein RJ639_011549 [Escallonia herrerae]
MVSHGTIEVAKTVLEVADAAWTAVECCHHQHHGASNDTPSVEVDKLESLRSENRRLRSLLDQNLKLLQNLTDSPCLLQDCPPDLHARLLTTLGSRKYLSQLKSLHQKSVDGAACKFPFKEATGADLHSAELLINVDLEEPSWWVWVTDEMVPSNIEERSAIDHENYVIVSEEHVVDGVAYFMARCVLSNPKAQTLTPEELQKTLTKALGGMNKLEKMLHVWHAGKMFYALSTWGLALTGLYQSRAVLKLAAKGVHTTCKVVLKTF